VGADRRDRNLPQLQPGTAGLLDQGSHGQR
jgi:hypothetical protein